MGTRRVGSRAASLSLGPRLSSTATPLPIRPAQVQHQGSTQWMYSSPLALRILRLERNLHKHRTRFLHSRKPIRHSPASPQMPPTCPNADRASEQPGAALCSEDSIGPAFVQHRLTSVRAYGEHTPFRTHNSSLTQHRQVSLESRIHIIRPDVSLL